MTSAEEFRAAAAHPTTAVVSIAGVPWPAYKLVALVVGVLILGIATAATASIAAGVLGGAAAATLVWVAAPLLGHHQ
ncbi:hypothetical protein [Mycolicibacterium palauense]|uniref:hypothetical protein n=1 Tax=Mycolicibacterium palauense TaxID=2034511 RepID=UPI000BFEF22C|nr:hypothetical protein [Mycolicibacterium palauense]